MSVKCLCDVGVFESYTRLMVICPACGRENPDESRFCGSCGALLVEAPPLRDVRKTVTVVFCDVTGSTALGEQLDPESLRRVMARYFDQMQAVVERHEGIVEKFIGDAVMAVFGVPVLHEDDALRAVRAAADMRERLDALNEELERDWGTRIQVRTGVNTGEVVAGDAAGGGQRFATGDAVNVAKRLEEEAPAGDILLGEPTYRLVRDAVEVEPVDSLELKGKEERVAAYRLLAVASGAEGRARRLDSPMVGREREQALLRQAFERARDDRACQLFTVLGAAGVGKSRLVAEFLSELGPEATVARGRCLSYGEGITFWPILEMVRGLHGEQFGNSIAAELGDDENAELIAERIAAAVGVADSGVAGEETFWAIRKLFEAHAQKRAFVAVLDDVQWGQRTFHDLIEHVSDWSRDAPILLVCLARPELLDERPGWGGGKFNATSVLLEPLNDEEAGQLVGNFLGQPRLDAAIGQRVIDAAEGNPLFVEEMLAMLIDDGLLERRNGGWAATGDLGDVAVPPTIQALLGARLDRLPPDERAVIERAAIEGKVFHRGSVAELAPTGLQAQVMHHLQALVRKELVRPDRSELVGEDAFRFRHLLIRDAAYEGMPKALRAELHERFTDWLERMTSGREAEYEEILGYHLEQAFRYRAELAPVDESALSLARKAAERLISAGGRARIRGDSPAVINLLDRATALPGIEASTRAAVLADLGDALREREPDRAPGVLLEAIACAQDARDVVAEARAKVRLAELSVQSGELMDRGREAILESISVFENAGDDRGLAEAWQLLGQFSVWMGNVADGEVALQRAFEYATATRDEVTRGEALIWLAFSTLWGPAPLDEVLPRIEWIVAEAGENHAALGCALATAGTLYALGGRLAEGRATFERGIALIEDLGQAVTAGSLAMSITRAELAVGDPVRAESGMRKSVATLEALGDQAFLSTVLGVLAIALIEQGRHDEAEEHADRALELAAADDIVSQGYARAAKAEVLASRGDFEDAIRMAHDADSYFDEADLPLDRVQTELSLCRVFRAAGRDAEAVEWAERAANSYLGKGCTIGAERARALVNPS